MAARLTAVAVALIVGVTLVAGLIVGAQRDDDSGPIDVLIYNGRVYTGNAKAPFAEAVAVRGNRIYRVGSNRDIKRLRRRATTVIDAHGGSVLAGFSDAHARLPIDETTAAALPVPASVVPAGPSLPSPPHGPDQAETAAPPARERAEIVKDAIEGAHRLGVTSLNTIAEDDSELQAYEGLRKDEALPLRVVAALRVDLPVNEATLSRLEAIRKAHDDDPLFRVDAVALRVTLPPEPVRKGRRARAQKPVQPELPALPRDLERALGMLDQRGWSVVLQVEDEQALAATLDGLTRLSATSAPAGHERRHRIELTRPMTLDVPRIQALGVAVSLPLPAQWAPGDSLGATVAVTPDATSADSSSSEGTAPPASQPHAGIRLLMASQSLADPRLGLQALVTGPELPDSPEAAAPVSEASLAAAIDAYTSTAAWASGDEGRRGTLARDMLADIVILSADLFTLSADKLLDAVVTVTIFDGKVVYDREAEATRTGP